MIEYKYKRSELKHKDLVNFQFDVLGVKSGTPFYQRQCGYAKTLLDNGYAYEDLMRVLHMMKEVGLPKTYKSIYWLGKNTNCLIEMASDYFENKSKNTETVEVKNKKVRRKFDVSM